MNEVFIFCDKHERRVPVAKFLHRNAGLLGGDLWDEQPVAGRYTAESIVNDAPEVPGWALNPENHQRLRHKLTCRRCGFNHIVKHDRLVALLGELGHGDVTLELVAARTPSS